MDLGTIYGHFPDEASCIALLEGVRWNGLPSCPYCRVAKACRIPDNRHHCNVCGTSFSVTVRTLFHGTKVDLQRWFLAIWVATDPATPEYPNVRELAAALGVNKNTVGPMLTRIRLAQARDPALISGIIQRLKLVNGGAA